MAEKVSSVAVGEARTEKIARSLTKRLKVSANGQYALRRICRNPYRIASEGAFRSRIPGYHLVSRSTDGAPHDFTKRNPSLRGNSCRPSDPQAKLRWRYARTLPSVASAEVVRLTPLLATLSATDASMLRMWRTRCGNGISMPASLKALATATVTSLWS